MIRAEGLGAEAHLDCRPRENKGKGTCPPTEGRLNIPIGLRSHSDASPDVARRKRKRWAQV